MNIRDIPCTQRPREKLLNFGPSILRDAELLAIFLRTGVPGRSAIELAEDLLARFGGIGQVFTADVNAFTGITGIGKAKYVQVQAALELSKRHLASNIPDKPRLIDSSSTQQYLALRLRDKPVEVFACIFLNNRNQVLHYEELFSGTIDHAAVYPRQIVRQVIKHNAAAVILAHNHPSGDPTPSDADIKLTNNIAYALEYIDVQVLDHIVIGGEQTVSMVDAGLLN